MGKKFEATHEWAVDGVVIPVVVDGGEVYDEAHIHNLREGRPGVASVVGLRGTLKAVLDLGR